MKLKFSRQIFEKKLNIKFYQNPFSGSHVFPCGKTGGRMDMTKIIVAFRSFANAPKKRNSKKLAKPFSYLLFLTSYLSCWFTQFVCRLTNVI